MERADEERADHHLAERISYEGFHHSSTFGKDPLFDIAERNYRKKNNKLIREERLGQSEIGLANSLIGIGTGSQPSYWDTAQGD